MLQPTRMISMRLDIPVHAELTRQARAKGLRLGSYIRLLLYTQANVNMDKVMSECVHDWTDDGICRKCGLDGATDDLKPTL